MRARRLRRLGLISDDTVTTATSSTEATLSSTTELTENIAKSSHTVAKNILCPESEENEENVHKQKQQKFDNEMKMEIGLNNNESAPATTTTTTDTTKFASKHLTQRSRLLDEIEKQQIENKLNQNTKEAAEIALLPDIEMETEENSNIKSSDSGLTVESMETDELSQAVESSLTATKMTVTQLCHMDKEKEAELCLSRILDAFWTENCEGQIIVSETAEFHKEIIIDEGNPIQFDDLAFQIITEIVTQYFDGKRIDFKATGSDSSTKNAVSSTTEPERMDTSELNCSTPNLKPHNLPDQGALTYLIQSYLRCCNEYDRYTMAKNQQKFDSVVTDVIVEVKKQLISSAKLLLNGTMMKQIRLNTNIQTHRSVLLKMMYDDAVPMDFLSLLLEESHKERASFEKIFGTVINNLYVDMQSRVVSKIIDTSPINILKQLLDINVTGNIRPICSLVAGLRNFCPTLCTATQGREIVKASYLGPFLSLSVFSEENPKLAEDVDDNWEDTFGTSLRMVSVISGILQQILPFFFSEHIF